MSRITNPKLNRLWYSFIIWLLCVIIWAWHGHDVETHNPIAPIPDDLRGKTRSHNDIGLTWSLYGPDMVIIWAWHGHYVGLTWSLYGCDMVIIWAWQGHDVGLGLWSWYWAWYDHNVGFDIVMSWAWDGHDMSCDMMCDVAVICQLHVLTWSWVQCYLIVAVSHLISVTLFCRSLFWLSTLLASLLAMSPLCCIIKDVECLWASSHKIHV